MRNQYRLKQKRFEVPQYLYGSIENRDSENKGIRDSILYAIGIVIMLLIIF